MSSSVVGSPRRHHPMLPPLSLLLLFFLRCHSLCIANGSRRGQEGKNWVNCEHKKISIKTKTMHGRMDVRPQFNRLNTAKQWRLTNLKTALVSQSNPFLQVGDSHSHTHVVHTRELLVTPWLNVRSMLGR